jgi:transcriptional regulator with PAS, ATPase and Fis domain
MLLLVHRGPRIAARCDHPAIIATSADMANVLDRVALAAPRDVTVLIRGETGVGKELVARALHVESGREGEFVAVNCSALSDGVLHSELFGHARGAFSGARDSRPGLVATAAGGTLFLDEIGDASPALQASMLRLLEQREYRAVGSDAVHRTDTRFVTATHVDLRAAVMAGRFRADLLNRLERWNIDVPALRFRRQDVLPLAHHFARRLTGGAVLLSRQLAFALLRYDWPGNVRELQAVMEQAVVAAPGATALDLDAQLADKLQSRSPFAYPVHATQPTLEDDTLPPPQKPAQLPPPKRRPPVRRPAPSELRARFQQLECNARRLAAELNIGRTTLYRWFLDAGIDIRELRSAGG